MPQIADQAGKTVVKVRLDLDYNRFVEENRVTSVLDQLARVLAIPVSDIVLLDLRAGCVILVIALPDDAAERLLAIGDIAADDALGLLARNLKVMRVTEGDLLEAPSFLSSPRARFHPDLAWLHLSDLHITADYGDVRSDTNADLSRLLEDLPKRLAESDIVPDAVFFTGDVAQSGEEEEYDAALSFFVDLQQSLPPASRRAPMLIVPGNHDVAWAAIDPTRELALRRELKASEDIVRVVRQHAPYIEERQRQYREFIDKSQGTIETPALDGLAFTYAFPAPARGVQVGVAGLNSAWLSTRKDLFARAGAVAEDVGDLDLQHLHLGSEQLRTAAAGIKGLTVKIALMHHEPLSEWYAEADRQVQRQELTRYDFVLRGHQHEPRLRVGAKVAGDDDFLELAAGALRTQPHWYQGFMTAELDLAAGLLRVTAWTVTGHGRRWVRDPEFGNGGCEIRALPNRLRERVRALG
jgi:predicted phosphodiesterase